MAEMLLKVVERSLARALSMYASGVAYIEGQDFNFDKKPNGSARALPYNSIALITEEEGPAFCDGNKTYDPIWTMNIRTVAENFTQLKENVGQMKNALRGMTATASGVDFYFEDYPGLPIWDETTSREVGVIEVELGSTEFFQAGEKSEWNNLKYSANTLVTLSPLYKERGKDLL